MFSGTASVNMDSKRLAVHLRLGCGSRSITPPAPLLAKTRDVQCVLHGQRSLAAVIYEAMNVCKNLRFIKGLL